MRVLFVVDNSQWVRAVEDLAAQFEVQVVHLGRKVPASIRDWSPDVLVLDVKLPHLNGVTVAQLVREDWPELPIVFASDDYEFVGRVTNSKPDWGFFDLSMLIAADVSDQCALYLPR